jgi:hypothetical protein
LSGERDLRRALHDTLQSVSPPPAPLEAIIRRGRRIRRRRTGAAAGSIALAGILAVAALAPRASAPRPSASPPTASPGPVVPSGVIAHGTADGHPWQLAVQDIADPGYACLPAITLNGTDADPVYPDPVTGAAVALGPALPGVGFGFVQLPADVSGIVVNGTVSVPAVTVAACGFRYHVAGFAYSLARPVQVTVANPPADWPPAFTMPVVSTQPPSTTTTPETAGLWINGGSVRGAAAQYTLAWGSLRDGQEWVIKLQFGTGGDCYEFDAPSSLGSAQMGYCGPVSTPDGPETIVALPIGFPYPGTGSATGYAVQVSPATAQLAVTLSDGSSQTPDFCVVDGRTYAAFVVPSPLHLSRLTWLDASGRVMASTTALPRYGYVQFQP